jgi:hypothetical protein
VRFVDHARIRWTRIRYGLWLDMYNVPRRERRELCGELSANLAAATHDIGVSRAIAGVGSVRTLAAETSRNGRRRSPWWAATLIAVTTASVTLLLFLFTSLYYVEGVLDAGSTQPVKSSLFPWFGSSVHVHNQGPGQALTIGLEPGWLPLGVTAIVFVLVAKPWRSIRARHYRANQPSAGAVV